MNPDIFNILILSVIQGITEFLPISSSGHLVVFQHLLGFQEDNLYYTVVLHAGTLCSIILYYFRDLLLLMKRENFRIILLVFVGTLPVVVIGLIVKPLLEKHFSSLALVSVCLLVTSLILLLLHKPVPGKKEMSKMRWQEALLIGMIQCVAILPGVSRSGSTISLATRFGFQHETAARFSFYLAIPAILGAIILEGIDVVHLHQGGGDVSSISLSLTCIGFFTSFAVGYFALKLLIHMLKRRTFSYFGYYCLSLSTVLIAYQIMQSVN